MEIDLHMLDQGEKVIDLRILDLESKVIDLRILGRDCKVIDLRNLDHNHHSKVVEMGNYIAALENHEKDLRSQEMENH
jgi:hypothetical protein